MYSRASSVISAVATAVIALATAGFIAPAYATVTWNLSGVKFLDGGTIDPTLRLNRQAPSDCR